MLYYIFILHQTTTESFWYVSRWSCIISSFYIKPQQTSNPSSCWNVVLYLHSTSNHNTELVKKSLTNVVLYLHSTSNHNFEHFDIPLDRVVLYLHSTSNHNFGNSLWWLTDVVLYLHSTSNHNFGTKSL